MSSSLSSFPSKIAVIGSGSFGSAMTRIVATAAASTATDTTTTTTITSSSSQKKKGDGGNDGPVVVSWYARRQSIVDEINEYRTNAQYFPTTGQPFPPNVTATSNLKECVDGANIILLALPGSYLDDTLRRIREDCCYSGDGNGDGNDDNWVLGGGGGDDDTESSGSNNNGSILVSVIKSLKYDREKRRMVTTVDRIQNMFPNNVALALSGPNLYSEMSSDNEFAEATIGYDGCFVPINGDENVDDTTRRRRCAKHKNKQAAKLVRNITCTSNFQTSLCPDRVGLELCGGLKNVISLSCGYAEGLGLGSNVKSAIIRAGLHEMAKFIDLFHPTPPPSNSSSTTTTGTSSRSSSSINGSISRRTVFETSAGVGDLVLTCTAGRGRTLAAAFINEIQNHGPTCTPPDSIKRWSNLERDMLNGMKLPDWHNVQEVYHALKDYDALEEFPLFHGTYRIGFLGGGGDDEGGGGGRGVGSSSSSSPQDVLMESLSQSIKIAAAAVDDDDDDDAD